MTSAHLSVLIPDGESDFALFVARCLAQVPNLRLHVLSSKRWAPLRFSRHRNTYHFQPWGDEERRLDAISQAVKRTGADVLLPVDEPAIQFASTNLQAIVEVVAIPPLPDPDVFETVTDKWLLAKLLQENHIPGPATILYTAGESFERDLCEMQFPVVIKPIKGRGGKGIRRFDNPTEFLHFADAVSEHSRQYIVQSFVHGYDVDCSVLCKGGKILAYTIQRGFIAGSPVFAAPAGVDLIQDDQVFDVISRLVSAVRWSGIAHMDLRYDSREKQVKLLEVNARYWGSLIGSLMVGVNFPHLACLAALNVSFPVPDYRLGRYIASGAAIEQGVRRFLGRRDLEISLKETALPHALGDPVAETVKLLRQAFAQNG